MLCTAPDRETEDVPSLISSVELLVRDRPVQGSSSPQDMTEQLDFNQVQVGTCTTTLFLSDQILDPSPLPQPTLLFRALKKSNTMLADDFRKEKDFPHLRHASTSSISSNLSLHPDHIVFLSSGMKLLQRMGYALIPSFLRKPPTRTQKLHPTSYLDGLRGVASLIVFVGHYTENNVGWYQEAYGLYEDRAASSPLQLPIVRIIYSGRPMVHVFFIISGFVLCYKPIKQIHEQQYSALSSTLSSSIFRRAIRLFLPSFICILIMGLFIQMGFYHYPAFDAYKQLENVARTCWALVDSAWYWSRWVDFPS